MEKQENQGCTVLLVPDNLANTTVGVESSLPIFNDMGLRLYDPYQATNVATRET